MNTIKLPLWLEILKRTVLLICSFVFIIASNYCFREIETTSTLQEIVFIILGVGCLVMTILCFTAGAYGEV